ncbi:LPXTG cell wall anchor domain-containing protein [Streptococcus penaeicida]
MDGKAGQDASQKAETKEEMPSGKSVAEKVMPTGMGNAKAPSQNPSASEQLPSTGDSVNPFFTAAALAVMASAGMVSALKTKKD